MNPVSIRRERVVLPTYEPQAPDRNPMFLEKRVYQGSSGRVYPLPFCDRIAEKPAQREWDAIYIENEFLLVMILPQLGGRIHRIVDKTNRLDVIYHQPVIKPALVGLAGPWISGGIEFNWPQHHRPSTFMPADVHTESHADGSATVWLSEHDPMARMKGMHGVCLHPGRALLELKVRLHNRTDDTQTFLWWANVAVQVHEAYQSFFPPDVTRVADHARRAMSDFPLCRGRYYGVDYASRARNGVPADEIPRQFVPPHCPIENRVPSEATSSSKIENAHPAYRPDDLSWYANIPVPTSFMCVGSHEDFFGGYDHRAKHGVVHIADHRIAPGKKQWTWGNDEFGYAWDRNLTDADERGEFRPYIELMAGVFTDNQPDFSFLAPGETRAWSQYWYPIREIGPACAANTDAAVSLRVERGTARLGVAVTQEHATARVRLMRKTRVLAQFTRDLSPANPLLEQVALPRGRGPHELTIEVTGSDGRVLISHTPRDPRTPAGGVAIEAAKEPPPPSQIASSEELYLTGLHLEQYRHATRMREDYWREGYRRDADDSRCHTALGRWHIRRGEFVSAEKHLRAAIRRLTRLNANPVDGEAFYHLGRCLRHLARDTDAYDAFAKAAWNHAWQSASFHAMAEIDCVRQEWSSALDHLGRSLRANFANLRARDLKALVLRRIGRESEAKALLRETLELDPLDWWARNILGEPLACETQVRLDLALDYSRAGFHAEALAVLEAAHPEPHSGTAPLVHAYRAWVCHLLDDNPSGRRHLVAAAMESPDWCFPARVEEIPILEHAIASNPRDARAPFLLGNLLYDRRRHREAIALWRRAVRLDASNAVAWRNLGIGTFNILKRPALARRAYNAAFRANTRDARILYERDQLWKRLGETPARRLRELERHLDLVAQRDDLSVELCALYNQSGRPYDALRIVNSRRFQPWEGGEGMALGQHVRTNLLIGRAALAAGDFSAACVRFLGALDAPENLGEAKHLLANQSDVHFWIGEAFAAAGNRHAGREHWTMAARFRGDFQGMKVREFSEMTYYSALALQRLGRRGAAQKLLRDLLGYARGLARTPARIDYFATSLPTMLLFDDDLDARQLTIARFLEAQARLGLGERSAARNLLRQILRRDPSHALARDLADSVA
jgi:tetratricopeptide (TPR) repeat protein